MINVHAALLTRPAKCQTALALELVAVVTSAEALPVMDGTAAFEITRSRHGRFYHGLVGLSTKGERRTAPTNTVLYKTREVLSGAL